MRGRKDISFSFSGLRQQQSYPLAAATGCRKIDFVQIFFN
jgi:hypothetical protein